MVAVAVIAFTGIGGFIATQALDHARSTARDKARFQADLAAHAIDDALVLGQTTLGGMLASFPVPELIAHPDGCRLAFSGLGPFSTGHLDVVLPDGRVICSSLAKHGAPAGASHAGTGWLTSVPAAPQVSPVFTDRLTGSTAVAIVAALPGGTAAPTARLALVLTLPGLSDGLAATYGGPEGFGFTIRQGDTTVSRSAQPGAADRAPARAPELTGSAPVTALPWRVQAGIGQAQALAPTKAILVKGSGLGLGALVLLVIVLILVNRQIARPLDRLAVAEGKLRTSEEQLRLLLLGARDYAIVMLDVDGCVASWSPSAQLLDGYAEEEILGRHFSVFFTGEEVTAGRPGQILQRAADSGREESEGVRVRQDGSLYWARSVLTARRDAADRVQGFVAVTYDATVRHEVEMTITRMNGELEQRVQERTTQLERQAEELHAANAELQAFTYSVSHDLRAPLRALNGFASLLSNEYAAEQSDQARDFAGRIVRSAQTLTAMVEALLSLSATQRIEISPATIDLNVLARSVWDELSSELDGRDVQFVLATLPPGQGDARLVRQVLANLLGNAVKYTRHREHATIEVGCRVTPDSTEYFVRDNGAGFDMQYSGALFEAFKRLHRAEEFPGTGIGLASVKRIITRHGGQVRAEGRPDQGATFYFTLAPAAEDHRPAESVQPALVS